MTFSKLQWLKGLHGVKMKPNTFRVLVAMFDYTNEHGRRAYPGNARLARDCCCSVSTIERALEELEELGLLRRVSRGGRSGNGAHWAAEYELFQPVKWGGSTRQNEDVNPSDPWAQHVTGDDPSDHVPTDHYSSDHACSAA
ncbi:helix-turn-helix domain-containing protein [Mycobacterium sp.]|uniref:helix-turn-helix domain-containing protein n=1 Tax=Mycobacterium sp. TaxID=1785 RepID=UPI00120972E7|nr:helix-turn-helix domain-containing protein [Mycobacterium sp.]TAM63549.1 MAG: hypothetical protein EPN51_26635 [Mycobacterium sp.]